MQCILHPWIRQTETLLQQVNAQNRLEGKGLTTAFGARACRREDMLGVAEKIQSWLQENRMALHLVLLFHRCRLLKLSLSPRSSNR